jgi:YgiT-type zinc finger domain-containing protein
MKCHVCAGEIKPATSDIPFKLEANRIVICKNLPILQCDQCGEYLIEDTVMARVEEILEGVDAAAELEIVRYAA